MKKIDKDGLLLCDIQANVFELSIDRFSCSSEIFIRRFSNSNIAQLFDNKVLLNESYSENNVLDLIEAEYKALDYGKNKYSKSEMYWIGYMYRYFCYTYEITMKQAYKTISPKEMRSVYLPYHTLDCSQAIERILEAKNISFDINDITKKGVIMLKKIRNEQIIR